MDANFSNSPKEWAWDKLPAEIEARFKLKEVKEVVVATFSDDEEGYFFLCQEKPKFGELTYMGYYGDRCPSDLLDWLIDPRTKQIQRDCASIKVILGPDGSFMAWDATSIRWSSIPKGLETTLQSWLSPAGWLVGPPRVVSLGHGGAYFVLSEYGSMDCSFPATWPLAQREFKKFDQLKSSNRVIEHVYLNPCVSDLWVIVLCNTYTNSTIPNFHKQNPTAKTMTDFFRVGRPYATEHIRKLYQEEMAREQEERKDKKKKESANSEVPPQTNDSSSSFGAQDDLETHQLHYILWLSACEAAFASKSIMTFPQLPNAAIICKLSTCALSRESSGLLACRHDFELILRASGHYSEKWLRTQRHKWHPDYFATMCHPDYRTKLRGLAGETFKIFGLLTDESS